MKLLKNTINISRPLVFLCGPYFEDKDYDRRKILKDFFATENKVIPIIVDKFLDKKNINDDSINIDLLEEICAAVSFKTYIFLDTFSSVAELGIFCSKAYQNEIDVFIPKDTDIIGNNIGFFIKAIIENTNNHRIKSIYYRPKIVRVPLASEYVTEYYEFTDNELPQNIKKRVISDDVFKIRNYILKFINGNSYEEENNVICYSHSDSKINFIISLRMLFYIVASILLENEELEVDEIVIRIKELLKNSLCIYENKDKSKFDEVQINTKVSYSIDIIIKHILKFIKLYNAFSDNKGKHIITKHDSLLSQNNAFDYFEISLQNRNLINEYLNKQENFVEIIKIKHGKKIRSVTKYKDDENGIKLRELHESILNKLENIYSFSDISYAYRKGSSILDCVIPHKNNISFLKIDIKNFFNSIKYLELFSSSKHILNNLFIIDKDYGSLLKACMYDNKLPLGLITSPILSDIYLHKLDRNICNILSEYSKKIIFTRYADDMIFSCEDEMDKNDYDYIINILAIELGKINLKINEEKTIFKVLTNFGDHIKILGLNIVKTNTQNKITIGKKFINDTYKMYLEYLKSKNSDDFPEETKFYTEKRLGGRIAYISQIEGLASFEKLANRIFKAIDHKVNKPNPEIDWKYLIELKTKSIG